tara:strand:- start:1701 stop:2186 length:486 start_codon:yes stop_codon:yes gene_type:complete
MEKVVRGLGLFFMILGVALLFNSFPGLTGYVVFTGFSERVSGIAGFVLLALGIFVLVILKSGIRLESAIHNDEGLVRLAKESTRNEAVKKEMNHLQEELGKGNFQAGIGKPGHVDGTSIFYLRGYNGARLFYRQIREGYEIVGKSDKRTEERVIHKLQEIY